MTCVSVRGMCAGRWILARITRGRVAVGDGARHDARHAEAVPALRHGQRPRPVDGPSCIAGETLRAIMGDQRC